MGDPRQKQRLGPKGDTNLGQKEAEKEKAEFEDEHEDENEDDELEPMKTGDQEPQR
jgi:hypothetical protein